jgi:hypothetical protein
MEIALRISIPGGNFGEENRISQNAISNSSCYISLIAND